MFNFIKNLNSVRKSEDGHVTIGELIVATAIFGTLASVGAPAAINHLSAGNNVEVSTKAHLAYVAIISDRADNGGNLPNSLGDTDFDFKKFPEAKVNAVIKGGNVCISGFHSKMSEYKLETPYYTYNGQPVEKCEFPTI